MCTLAHCEHVDPPPAHHPRTMEKTSVDDIPPFSDLDGPIEAKGGGGRGGGHGSGKGGAGSAGAGGGGAHISSANSKSLSNPLSGLRGPILLLNWGSITARAQASREKVSAQAADSGFVGKTLWGAIPLFCLAFLIL